MSRKLRVLHIASWYPSAVHPSLGNFVARHVEATAKVCDVEVWAPIPVGGSRTSVKKMKGHNGMERFDVDGQHWTVRRLYHEASRPQLLGIARSVAAEAVSMDWKPDVVHLHVAYPAGAAAIAWAKRWKVPVVLTEHWTAYHDFNALPWWRRRVIRDVVRQADVLCPVSADLGDAMTRAISGTNAPVQVIPNVVDTNRFKLAEPELLSGVPVGATRRRLEGRSIEHILHVSSMNDDQKNIQGLLLALAAIMERHIEMRATFVGGEKVNLSNFCAWVNQRGLADRITFTGPLNTDEVVAHMQTHDVLVLNSRRENFPCVIPEAWACGIPVMSTDVGGIREHLTEGLTVRGYLLPEHATTSDWIQAMEAMKSKSWDPLVLRQLALDTFSMNAVGAAYEGVYNRLLGEI